MRIEILARDGDSAPFFQTEASGAGTVSATLDYVLFGDSIEVRVKDDEGKILSDWVAKNTYPAANLTVTQFSDGSIAVTDNASNTYTKVVKDA